MMIRLYIVEVHPVVCTNIRIHVPQSYQHLLLLRTLE